jgi:hypothetical protein
MTARTRFYPENPAQGERTAQRRFRIWVEAVAKLEKYHNAQEGR